MASNKAGTGLWLTGAAGWLPLIGKWFVFWGVGIRLLVAGIRQVARRSTEENWAMVSDLLIFLVLAVFVVAGLLQP